jgi:acetyl esterase/lipase
VRHVTSAFPPTFISVGNGDPLAPQSMAMADALRSVRVPVDTLFFSPDHQPALPHEYQFDLTRPEGRLALERVVAFLGRLEAARPRGSTGPAASGP